jgi:FkbM family methyltransferase
MESRNTRPLTRIVAALLKVGLVFAGSLLAVSIVRAFLPSSPLLRSVSAFPELAVTTSRQCSLRSVWESLRAATAEDAAADAYKVKVVRTDGAFTQVQTAAGQFWMPQRDVNRTSFVFLEEEHGIYGFGDYRVGPGDVVLDCGANVGAFARRCLKAGASKVICIDPSPESVECLRRNFSTEIGDGRVVVCPIGVWNTDDWLELTVSDSYSVADTVVLQGPGLRRSGQKVRLTTIDKLVAEQQLSRVDFIKMDIEGAERQALEGARDTVARFRPKLAIALEHRPDDLRDIPALIVRQWPSARVTCGPCSLVRSTQVFRVQPEVMFAAF